jgi:hypothetical protein
MTELVSVWAKNHLYKKSPDKVNSMLLRAGYLPKERQELERNLKAGDAGDCINKCAELGIDMGLLMPW